MADSDELVQLTTALDPVRAHLICNQLENAGIPAVCQDVNAWTAFGWGSPLMNGVPVMVRQRDLLSGRKVLEELELARKPETDDPDEDTQE